MKLSEYICAKNTAGTSAPEVRTVDQIVVNWHLTEACNYSCRYCYSSWEKGQDVGELFHDENASRYLLRELYHFFSPGNTSNPLHSCLKWKDLRLSLAGGEPLLYPKRTAQIVSEAKELGFKVSLITNACMLCRGGLEPLLSNLSMLGVSLDSGNEQTCRQIGRVDQAGQILNLAALERTINKARSLNPGLAIKVNTVVNKFNFNENLTELVERLVPDKWKVLRVLPVINDDLAVSDQQFQSFVKRHQHLANIISAENNQEMTESYLMVDPHGRFFQNQPNVKTGDSYNYSSPILQVGAGAAFRQIDFDVTKFIGRYSMPPMEVAA